MAQLTKKEKSNIKLTEIENSLKNLHNKMEYQNCIMADLYQSFQNFEKITKKHIDKQRRELAENPSRNYGFANPSTISDELRSFMGLEQNDLCSRTNVTKHLNNYVKEKKLQNPKKKTEILPDETLAKLLGDDAVGKTITYFTIQKYMNKHFLQRDPTA